VVVVWGERLSHGERGQGAVDALLATASALGLGEDDGGGLLEVPALTNGRGLREVGCLPNMGPGLADVQETGLEADRIAEELGGDLQAVLLLQAEPEAAEWEDPLEQAGSVIAVASFRSELLDRHADVVFPAESWAEKEGTVTHPDGRLQRLRQSIPHPDEVRPGWAVLVELCERLDVPVEAASSPMVTSMLADAVPFYAGITLEEIGGKGVRWQERDAASEAPEAELSDEPLADPPPRPEGLHLGAAPSLWAGPEVEHSASLRFLAANGHAEFSPDDAHWLGIGPGDDVVLSFDGQSVRASASVRTGLPAGSVFLGSRVGAPRRVEVRKA
jgi:NADH-quinone oxidoreductase subunit G